MKHKTMIAIVALFGGLVFFTSKGGDAGFLKVKLPNHVSSIAAIVEVTLADGSMLTKPFVSGEGLCSDPSHILVFGLGDQHATNVTVTYLDGIHKLRNDTWRNNTVIF